MAKYGKTLILAILPLLLLTGISAEVERGATWDRVCDNGVCTQTLYSGAVNTLNETGDYVPFEDVTSYSWSPSAEGWNFTGSFKNFSAWFILKPYVQHSNGNWYDYSDIKDAFPNANFTNHIQTSRGSHKFALNITNIPQELADNIALIAFSVEGSYNLGWDDIRLEHPCVIIKEKVSFCYQDILDSKFTLNLYNKSVLLIGNVTGKTDIILDPTITLRSSAGYCTDDAPVDELNPTTNYGSTAFVELNPQIFSYGKYAIDSLPTGVTIDSVYWTTYMDTAQSKRYEIRHVYNQTWDEESIIWNMQPCGVNISDATQCNKTYADVYIAPTSGSFAKCTDCFDLTYPFQKTVADGDSNFSFVMNSTVLTGTNSKFAFKEDPAKHYLTITFTYSNEPFWYVNQSSTPAEYTPIYPAQFNVTWNTSNETIANISWVLIEGNWSGSPTNYTMLNMTYGEYIFNYTIPYTNMPVGIYYWKSWANTTDGTYDIWNVTDTWVFAVAQNTTNPVSMNMSTDGFVTNTTDANITVTTAQTISINGYHWWATSGVIELYIDGAVQTNPYSNTFGVGTHEIIVNSTGNANYTANSTGITFYVITTADSGSSSSGGGSTIQICEISTNPSGMADFVAPVKGWIVVNNLGTTDISIMMTLEDIDDYCNAETISQDIAGLSSASFIIDCFDTPENGVDYGIARFSGSGCSVEVMLCVGFGCGIPLSQFTSFGEAVLWRFPTNLILALLNPSSERWDTLRSTVGDILNRIFSFEIGAWMFIFLISILLFGAFYITFRWKRK